jgi:uncharacterized membrane protein YcjF (UPF0283 family)
MLRQKTRQLYALRRLKKNHWLDRQAEESLQSYACKSASWAACESAPEESHTPGNETGKATSSRSKDDIRGCGACWRLERGKCRLLTDA